MNYFQIYQDVWNFHKKFADAQDSDEYWESVCAEHEQIVEKYRKNPFARAMMMCVISELEFRSKEKQNEV